MHVSAALMNQALTQADDGRSIALHVGDQFKLSLRESRMAGYRRNMVEKGEPVLTSVETEEHSRPPELGAPRMRAWQFKAEKPGSTRIFLQHRRPWETAGSGDDFSLSVSVVG
jgi:predicted secreted protein